MAHVELSETPDATKAAAPEAPATPVVEKAAEPAAPATPETPSEPVEKAAQGESTTETPDLTELVKAAVAEAVAPLQAELAKAMAQPEAGGPVLTRTQQDTNKAAAREGLLTKAAEYEATAEQLIGDPSAQRAYRSEAKKLRDQAALTS